MQRTSFFFLFTCLFFLVYLSASLPGCNQPAPTPSPIVSWITQHALPLKTTDLRASLEDLQLLEQVVGNASIDGPIGQWMNGPHGFLTIGSVYIPAADDTYYEALSLPQNFDVIIQIQKVTVSQLLL